MLNISDKTHSSWRALILPVLFLLISIGPTFGNSLILDDPFHHGEYFASAVSFFAADRPEVTPLTIHGALDFIPAMLAESMWGQERYFFPTWVIYRILDLFSAIAVILIAYEFTKNKVWQAFLLVALAVIAPKLVGYRDVFLLVSFYVFLLLQTRRLSDFHRTFLQFLLGALTGFGLFWSFDRGIAAALSLGVAILLLSYKRRSYAFSLASFVAIAVLISYSVRGLSFSNYFENLKVLVETAPQWGYGWNVETLILTAYAFQLNVTVLLILLSAMLKNIKSIEVLALPAALAAISVFMLKVGINRADILHIQMSLWAPVLVFMAVLGGWIKPSAYQKWMNIALVLASLALMINFRNQVFMVVGGFAFFVSYAMASPQLKSKTANYILSLIFVIPVAILIVKDVKKIIRSQYSWILRAATPPVNSDVSTEGVRWASNQLIEHKSKCVFDLSNNGVINGLAHLPSCTRFTYPVYAASKHEVELIEGVKFSSPSAIVYSSNYWSYSIDGRKMSDRFPALDTYLREAYPNEKCVSGYCVRYLRRQNEQD